jgi:hypothetical protein
MTGDILNFIQSVGVPITVALATGAFLCSASLGKLKKQVQALDNDMIRLDMKLKILIQERHITDKHRSNLDLDKDK